MKDTCVLCRRQPVVRPVVLSGVCRPCLDDLERRIGLLGWQALAHLRDLIAGRIEETTGPKRVPRGEPMPAVDE